METFDTACDHCQQLMAIDTLGPDLRKIGPWQEIWRNKEKNFFPFPKEKSAKALIYLGL